MIRVDLKTLQTEKTGQRSKSSFGEAVVHHAIRAEVAKQEQRVSSDIAQTRRSLVFIFGRRSALAAAAKPGDRLTYDGVDWEIKTLSANREGMLQAVTQEAA